MKLGKSITSGTNNIFLGRCSGGNATITGADNIAFGFGTGKNLTSGADNIFIGKDARL